MRNVFRNILIASVILSLNAAPVAMYAMPEPVPATQTDKQKAAAQKKKEAEKRKKEQEKAKAQREKQKAADAKKREAESVLSLMNSDISRIPPRGHSKQTAPITSVCSLSMKDGAALPMIILQGYWTVSSVYPKCPDMISPS